MILGPEMMASQKKMEMYELGNFDSGIKIPKEVERIKSSFPSYKYPLGDL